MHDTRLTNTCMLGWTSN